MPTKAAVEDVYNILTTMGQEQSTTSHEQPGARNANDTTDANGINAGGAASVVERDKATERFAIKGAASENDTGELSTASVEGAAAKVRSHA